MAKRSDYVRVPGPQRYYQHITTGEKITRRQYDKLAGIQYERKAHANKTINESLQVLRPARGRKSALKTSKFEQQIISEARLDEKRRKEAKRRIEKKERQQVRKAQHNKTKTRRVRGISVQSLKKGSMGVRRDFDTYEQYLILLESARKLYVRFDGNRERAVFGYAIGVRGYDTESPRELGAFLMRLQYIDKTISRDDLLSLLSDFEESKPYFQVVNFFIHFAFNKSYALWKRDHG